MKITILGYGQSGNYGDEIQSIAARNLLPHVDAVIARENLKTFASPDKHILLFNGWHTKNPENVFPPSPDIIPIYYGLHLTSNTQQYIAKSPECIAHFKQWSPIGCRDRGTMEFLQSLDINAFYSKCLTLTFPPREKQLQNGKVFLVDCDAFNLPKHLIKNTISISHRHKSDNKGDEFKTKQAQKLLDLYKTQATLIITRRLHCALPCQAMGIPTLYFQGQTEYRTTIYTDLDGKFYRAKFQYGKFGVKIRQVRLSAAIRLFKGHKLMDFLPFGYGDIQSDVLDLSKEAQRIRKEVNKLIEAKLK